MDRIEQGETARALAPLAERAAAIVVGLDIGQDVVIRTAGKPAPRDPQRPCVTLMRGAELRIVREPGERRFTLTCPQADDPALAALIACIVDPGAPIAVDPESLAVLSLAERLARSSIPVLVNGPTGTGKEVLARFLHQRSPRRNGPFVAINCAAIPETMLEALLFGHQKGAFTGATQAGEGFFRAADGGTLLLDEVAELPLGLQAKVLRALQEGEVVPVGSTRPIAVDVRIVACANRDLPTEVAEGRFRADLFYRLNVFPLSLRPLRERQDDIAALAFALLLRHAPAERPVVALANSALAMLRLHPWPGNVRELENVVRRALLLADGEATIRPEHIVFDRMPRLVSDVAETGPGAPQPGGQKLSNIVQLSEARAIIETLDACGGSRIAAAKRLGISERTLRYRLASFREAGLQLGGGRR